MSANSFSVKISATRWQPSTSIGARGNALLVGGITGRSTPSYRSSIQLSNRSPTRIECASGSSSFLCGSVGARLTSTDVPFASISSSKIMRPRRMPLAIDAYWQKLMKSK